MTRQIDDAAVVRNTLASFSAGGGFDYSAFMAEMDRRALRMTGKPLTIGAWRALHELAERYVAQRKDCAAMVLAEARAAFD